VHEGGNVRSRDDDISDMRSVENRVRIPLRIQRVQASPKQAMERISRISGYSADRVGGKLECDARVGFSRGEEHANMLRINARRGGYEDIVLVSICEPHGVYSAPCCHLVLSPAQLLERES